MAAAGGAPQREDPAPPSEPAADSGLDRADRGDDSPPAATDAAAAVDSEQVADVTTLIPIVRRVVAARVRDAVAVDDLVQETLVRVLGAADRISPDLIEPYAIVTARNLVASMWQEKDRHRRNQHRVLDLRPPETPDESLLVEEERAAVSEAMRRLPDAERAALLAHEVAGQDTRSLADERGSTAGAVAAQLNRARARLRVEYLLALEQTDPPTQRCRPVLLALSGADRRRQRELDAARHLLECDFCARLSQPLLERGQQRDDTVRIRIAADSDVVTARQRVREVAAQSGFTGTDLTVIATAVSEVARNIVRFAGWGEIAVRPVDGRRRGLEVVARDTGPGIVDLEQALSDGYSTYRGLGLGLPGARRLMDEFSIESEPGRGTTVTMTKWQQQ